MNVRVSKSLRETIINLQRRRKNFLFIYTLNTYPRKTEKTYGLQDRAFAEKDLLYHSTDNN
uniref:Uncharacterized protein n=1 Tax=Megaselia scalaris TaxID=36166 RepID=T1GH26_MEGSC